MGLQSALQASVAAVVRNVLDAVAHGRDVEETMQRLADATTPLDLGDLRAWEQAFRIELSGHRGPRPSPLRRIGPQATRFSSWLDLCSANGHERERSLRVLPDAAPNAFLFAMVLRRLNDWVAQVRGVARERVPQIAAGTDPQHVVTALWFVLARFGSWGRIGEEGRQRIVDLIALPHVAAAFAARIASAHAGPAAAILAQAGRAPALDRWWFEIATTAVQPAVRVRAYRWLLEERAVWSIGRRWTWTDLRWCKGHFEHVLQERCVPTAEPMARILELAASDTSPFVRRVAAEVLLRRMDQLGDAADALAERLARDAWPSVAERGRIALARRVEAIASPAG